MVSIFPNLCLWRRSLRSNLGGIDLEKLYRATLISVRNQFAFQLRLNKGLLLDFPRGKMLTSFAGISLRKSKTGQQFIFKILTQNISFKTSF